VPAAHESPFDAPELEEYAPAVQDSQLDAPEREEYVPAAQDSQLDPAVGEYVPALQLEQLDEPDSGRSCPKGPHPGLRPPCGRPAHTPEERDGGATQTVTGGGLYHHFTCANLPSVLNPSSRYHMDSKIVTGVIRTVLITRMPFRASSMLTGSFTGCTRLRTCRVRIPQSNAR